MSIETARAASLAARWRKALDKPWRDPDTREVYTLGERINSGYYAYVLIREWSDGTVSRGLISHANAAEALTHTPNAYYPGADDARQGLTFATHIEAGKLVCDYAAETLPTVTMTPSTFAILPSRGEA